MKYSCRKFKKDNDHQTTETFVFEKKKRKNKTLATNKSVRASNLGSYIGCDVVDGRRGYVACI